MRMEILGKHISTVDWYGRVSYVLFFNGCKMGCWYCHNRTKPVKHVSLNEIVDDIREHLCIIDAVVFSGGEPLLRSYQLYRIMQALKDTGLEFAIETAGYGSSEFFRIRNIHQVFWDIKADLTSPADWRRWTVPQDAYSDAVQFCRILQQYRGKVEYRFTLYEGYTQEKVINNITYLSMFMPLPLKVRLIKCREREKEITMKEIHAIKARIKEIFGDKVVINA